MTPSATTSSDGEQHKSEGKGRSGTNYDGAVEETQLRSDAVPPPPDGGYGWVCTACCAVSRLPGLFPAHMDVELQEPSLPHLDDQLRAALT